MFGGKAFEDWIGEISLGKEVSKAFEQAGEDEAEAEAAKVRSLRVFFRRPTKPPELTLTPDSQPTGRGRDQARLRRCRFHRDAAAAGCASLGGARRVDGPLDIDLCTDLDGHAPTCSSRRHSNHRRTDRRRRRRSRRSKQGQRRGRRPPAQVAPRRQASQADARAEAESLRRGAQVVRGEAQARRDARAEAARPGPAPRRGAQPGRQGRPRDEALCREDAGGGARLGHGELWCRCVGVLSLGRDFADPSPPFSGGLARCR